MTTYNFSIVADFSGLLNTWQLHQEINNNLNITTTLLKIDTIDDDVKIVFENALSIQEQSILSDLIVNYTTIIPNTNFEIITTRRNSTNLTKFQVIDTWIYDTKQYNKINNISVQSYCTDDIDSYDIRVCDITNGTILATANFTNYEQQLNNLGELTNIPISGQNVIEIQAKRNGGKGNDDVFVDKIVIGFI